MLSDGSPRCAPEARECAGLTCSMVDAVPHPGNVRARTLSFGGRRWSLSASRSHVTPPIDTSAPVAWSPNPPGHRSVSLGADLSGSPTRSQPRRRGDARREPSDAASRTDVPLGRPRSSHGALSGARHEPTCSSNGRFRTWCESNGQSLVVFDGGVTNAVTRAQDAARAICESIFSIVSAPRYLQWWNSERSLPSSLPCFRPINRPA